MIRSRLISRWARALCCLAAPAVLAIASDAMAIGCGTAPSCALTVNGVPVSDGQIVDVCAGEPFTIHACATPGCESSRVKVKLDGAPDWCDDQEGDSVTSTSNGAQVCFEVTCTPGENLIGKDPGEFQFQINNTELFFLGTECDVYIRVVCCEEPWCAVTPSDRYRVEATKEIQFTVCVASNCGNPVQLRAMGEPDWCEPIDMISNNGEIKCVTVKCRPGEEDVGDHTITIQAKDMVTEMTSECQVRIRVDPLCPTEPSCDINAWVDDDQRNGCETPSRDVDAEFCVGEKITVEICIGSACEGHEVIGTIDQLPSFCAPLPDMRSPRGDRQCITFTCTPGPNDVGLHRIKIKVVDTCNGKKTECRFSFRVNENKPPCDDPPVCDIVGPTSVKVSEGEWIDVQACATSACGSGEAKIEYLSGPDFCEEMDENWVTEQHDDCIKIRCRPEKGDEGGYELVFKATDTNGQTSTCKVWLEVNCDNPPLCDIYPRGPLYVYEGDVIRYKVCGESACADNAVRVSQIARPPFCDAVGHVKGAPGEKVCLEVECVVGPGQNGSYWAKYLVEDLENGQTTECKIQIVKLERRCDKPPVCEVTPGEGQITTAEFQESTIEVCATGGCDFSEMEILTQNLPAFCTVTASSIDENGRLCQTFTCSPQDGDAGTYIINFIASDKAGHNLSSLCVVKLFVEEGVPAEACMDFEPNGVFSKCTMVDALDCGAAESTLLAGSLGDVGNGCDDVDFYCVLNLTPSTEYCAIVVGGMDRGKSGSVLDTRVGYFDANGFLVESADEGGPFPGASMLCFTTLEDGSATLAVTGGPDGDFDGLAAVSGEFLPHGVCGDYTIMIVLQEPVRQPIECQADLNANGLIDTADLGVLIEMFGRGCGP